MEHAVTFRTRKGTLVRSSRAQRRGYGPRGTQQPGTNAQTDLFDDEQREKVEESAQRGSCGRRVLAPI